MVHFTKKSYAASLIQIYMDNLKIFFGRFKNYMNLSGNMNEKDVNMILKPETAIYIQLRDYRIITF